MFWIVERAKSKRVHRGYRPGAHGEDIAEDPSDAGRGALERLDETWVIVRFDLERYAPVVTDIDHTGIFTWRNNDARTGRRQPLQMYAGRFIRAVLRPHDAEHTELRDVGLATHD